MILSFTLLICMAGKPLFASPLRQLEKPLKDQFMVRRALEKALGYKSSAIDSSNDSSMPKLDKREPDDSFLSLVIWTPGETSQSNEPPEICCNSQETARQEKRGRACDSQGFEGVVAFLWSRKEDPPRPPLVPSEKNNAVTAVRKPRMREISSRYKSAVSSTIAAPRRCPSPNAGRTSPTSGAALPKRSQSAERQRPSTTTPRYSAPSSPTSRPTSRPSTPPTPSSRSPTPVRDSGLDLLSASRRSFGVRANDGLWPSMRSLTASFQSESVSIPLSRKEKPFRDRSPDHSLKSSINVGSERKRTPLRGRNTSDQSENSRPVENSHSRVVEQHRWPGISGGKMSAISLSRSMDLTEKELAGVNVSSTPSGRAASVIRPSRTHSSPLPGVRRPSSPNKNLPVPSSTTRGTQSPSRARPSTPFSSSSSTSGRIGVTSSVLNYTVDMRKGKKSANQIEDGHQLRLLYNRNLQWLFVNALSDAVSIIQKMAAEDILYTVWSRISELHSSVTSKRINLQYLKEEMKLNMILKEQMAYLEDWATLEKEHSSSLSAAIEALKASTLRLPVSGGTRVDVRAVKNAISSAVDVMQAMGSSVCFLLSKVEGMNLLASELSDAAAKERAMLNECRELLSSTAAIQVQESSLRTHLIQLRQDFYKMK
ncbi:hypothetical protein J5N97_026932 [Dioscorea zingiberensis]|uniref:AUGMIN subunit 8 n=1 Tax=Dioscorea zingiberensis TaxID=325984 RepID=A0A9D5H752_9LILI|nr:hypothetical protein J5N97_026932 [Dioscorea zingiberensis]